MPFITPSLLCDPADWHLKEYVDSKEMAQRISTFERFVYLVSLLDYRPDFNSVGIQNSGLCFARLP